MSSVQKKKDRAMIGPASDRKETGLTETETLRSLALFTARFAQDAKIAKISFLSNRNGRFDKSISPSGILEYSIGNESLEGGDPTQKMLAIFLIGCPDQEKPKNLRVLCVLAVQSIFIRGSNANPMSFEYLPQDLSRAPIPGFGGPFPLQDSFFSGPPDVRPVLRRLKTCPGPEA